MRRRGGCSIRRGRRSRWLAVGRRTRHEARDPVDSADAAVTARSGDIERSDDDVVPCFFDVDFTLIYPGPDVPGRRLPARAARRTGIEVDPAKFDAATAASSFILDEVEEQIYNARSVRPLHRVDHRAHGRPRPATSSRWRGEIYEQWSVNHHFEMYDDVAPVLTAVERARADRRRDLELASQPRRVPRALLARGLITVSVSSAEHGYMKPHRSIFDAALANAPALRPERR